MATTTFKPSTDNFGRLTLNGTILGGLSEDARRDHVNLLIALTFLIILVIAGIGLYRADQAVFGHPHNQVAAARNVAVDYD